MELVSVIMPTYNGSRYILSAVQSVLNQTYASLEIIVVDDGSTEDIRHVLAPVYDEIVYIRQSNAGPGAARNLGLQIARGKYIAFLDDDDLWFPAKTEIQVKQLEENPHYAMVYSYPCLIDENGKAIPNERPAVLPSGDVYLDFLRRNRVNTPSTTLMRRSVFDEVGLFVDSDCEDYDLWLRVARKHAVAFCPKTLTCYRIRPTSLSKNYERFLKSHVAILDNHLSFNDTSNKYPREKVLSAITENKLVIYKKFAYLFYYEHANLKRARYCLLESLKIRVMDARDVFYFLLFSLPLPVVNSLRLLKRNLSRLWRQPSISA